MNKVSESGLPSAALGTPERVDGRRLRSERTRQAILGSYLELLREKLTVPTYQEVAIHAGVSQRALFVHFSDREELAVAAFDLILSLHRSVPAGDVLAAGRAERIRFQVEQRARTCELWLPLWKMAITGRNRSLKIERRVEVVLERCKARLETVYERELATLHEPERTATLSALDELTSFEGWDRMRTRYKLDYNGACNAWIYAIDKLLPPTP
jgi:AcrR family transcriptional regulator